MKLSLCMIVKNEENRLKDCLASVHTIVDEIIIVDTGSTDKTIEIAKVFTSKVYSYSWQQDFGAARNYALQKATSEWILIMDADEVFAPNQRDQIYSLLNQEAEAFQVQIINYLSSNSYDFNYDLACRIIKNNHRYRYSGSLHERIIDSIISVNPAAKILNCPEIKIYHYGYLPSELIEKKKKNRNLTILQEQNLKNPDPFFLYALGCEYYQIGNYKQALLYFQDSLRSNTGDQGYKSDLINKIIWCYKELENYTSALECLMLAKQEYPLFTDLYFIEALIYWELKKYKKALLGLDQCVKLGEAPPEFSSYHGVGGFRAYFTKGLIEEENLCLNSAIKNYLQSLRANPEFTVPIVQILRLFQEWSNISIGLSLLDKHIDFSNPKFMLFLIKTLLSLEEYSFVESHLNFLKEKGYTVEKTLENFLLGIVSFHKENFSLSHAYFSQLPLDSKFYLLSIEYLFLLLLLDPFQIKKRNNEDLFKLDFGNKAPAFNLIYQLLSGFPSVKIISDIIHIFPDQTGLEMVINLIFKLIKLLLQIKKISLALPLISCLSGLLKRSSDKVNIDKYQLLLGNLLFKKNLTNLGYPILKKACKKGNLDLEALINLHNFYLKKNLFLKAERILNLAHLDCKFNLPKIYLLLAKNYNSRTT